MDAMIAAAARALSAGDVLSALQRVALRKDPPALALRGIAMAQLGELERARELLRGAARGFGRREPLAHARCVVADAEVALALRELGGSPAALAAAAAALEARADHANAAHARLLAVRRLLLLGRLDEAAAALAALEVQGLPAPALVAVAGMAAAEIGLRQLHTASAREALDRAQTAAARAQVPALSAEVADAQAQLHRPAARRWRGHEEPAQPLGLAEVEALLDAGAMVVDACRHGLRRGRAWWPLVRRPTLFQLALALAEAWPGDVDRDVLIGRVFRQREPDETHRARLRVEIGRLRALAAPLARIEASAKGFRLLPHEGRELVLLLPPIEGDADHTASLLALLADGRAWSTSALALALGQSQRTVQRALASLQAAGRVRSMGRARSQRWLSPPLAGFTTILLLPAALPIA